MVAVLIMTLCVILYALILILHVMLSAVFVAAALLNRCPNAEKSLTKPSPPVSSIKQNAKAQRARFWPKLSRP